MKTAPFLLVSTASSLESSVTADHLLEAVGQRNVTHMQALVQGLAEESIREPGWKFDEDIKVGLDAIRKMFVTSIQNALKDQHRVDQETHNCETEKCFSKCGGDYAKSHQKCTGMIEQCHAFKDEHETCRTNVYTLYKDMANACGELHCFEPPKIECQFEKCICPDVMNCFQAHHKDSKDHKHDAYGEDKKLICEAHGEKCESHPEHGFGAWLQTTISSYDAAHAEWSILYRKCSDAYVKFLHADVECDGVQRKFEQCMCERSSWADTLCSVDFAQCQSACWDTYEERLPGLQCAEKDRKIDWSATKKIECYLDVLLHDYTEEELTTKCGSGKCINVAREEDYKDCSKICTQVDHDGHWPEVLECKTPIKIDNHERRKEKDQYHLGDGDYACDANGAEVFTDHRGGGKSRDEELRCTEHLDIDFQIPPYLECESPPGEVCDAQFLCTYYAKFDDTSEISCISDCCPEEVQKDGKKCFAPVQLISCSGDGGAYEEGWTATTKTIKFGEHTHAWAYNRCECRPCTIEQPEYDTPTHRECGMGVHTIGGGDAYGR